MGVYVTTALDPQDASKLKTFVDSLPMPIGTRMKQDEYHITLAYSKEGFDYKESDLVKGCCVKPLKWDIFGEEEKVLVLIVGSDILQERWRQLCGQGYKCKFPDYKPHITCGIAPPPSVDVSQFPIPQFDITILHEYSEPLDDSFSYKPKTMCESFLHFLTLNLHPRPPQ